MKGKINIGIDASRNRSGGARAHIIGILNEEVKNKPLIINNIHIWAYPELLSKLPNDVLIIKHSPLALNKSLIHQLKWQFFDLAKEAKINNIDIMLNTDAGTISRFKPSVTMSRDMLSYEKGEMKRFGFSLERARLIILKYIQNYSLRKSVAAIFLTNYASEVIQKSSGKINNLKVIPHGVSDNFRIKSNNGIWEDDHKIIKCVYVSNVDFYKHQWNVALAIEKLRKEGYNITIDFIGGGVGKPQKKFQSVLRQIKESNKFIFQHESVSHNNLPSFLCDKDIFVFASSCENMPNTLIEGMCTGLPIACSIRGPMPEVLGDAGIYFDPENIDSIKESIKTIINDKDERKRIAQKSKELSIQYSWRRCSNEIFELLCNNI
jgi:glycosyltransferase involved in cell wall biosynthesis